MRWTAITCMFFSFSVCAAPSDKTISVEDLGITTRLFWTKGKFDQLLNIAVGKNGKVINKWTSEDFSHLYGTDLVRLNGKTYLILNVASGGNHCCSRLQLYELHPTPTYIGAFVDSQVPEGVGGAREKGSCVYRWARGIAVPGTFGAGERHASEYFFFENGSFYLDKSELALKDYRDFFDAIANAADKENCVSSSEFWTADFYMRKLDGDQPRAALYARLKNKKKCADE
ncbi:MAG: hypothetical protein EPN55_03880 [Gammaproteobacteria bacterium]|nr:MAG: hypothetical protein EPN55_03880 [Gammaproteobacteria bacterium]